MSVPMIFNLHLVSNERGRCVRSICLCVALLLAIDPAHADETASPHVFLITVDTLRADHLGSYGYARGTSPHIDAFAAGATLFEVALSQAPNTIPSMLQIMTSRYGLAGQIHENQTTLAGLLKGQGYETAAVVDNPLFEFDSKAHGLSLGFDRFYRNALVDRDVLEGQHYKTNTPADTITAQAGRVLDRRKRGSPFFLWLHYFDPHDPYAPPFGDDLEELSRGTKSPYTGDIRGEDFVKGLAPNPQRRDVQHIIDLYDAEIRYVDQSLGEFFAKLKREGLYDSSLIILTSDHGESFGEHGVWMHGRSLYEGEVRIPLIVKLPRQIKGMRVEHPVQAIDILPTVADLIGAEPASSLDGSSLFAEAMEPALILWHKHKVVRTRKWKLYEIEDRVLLYRIDLDPGEEKNLALKNPGVVANLRRLRDVRLTRIGQSPREIHRLTTEAVEQMRALGYIE